MNFLTGHDCRINFTRKTMTKKYLSSAETLEKLCRNEEIKTQGTGRVLTVYAAGTVILGGMGLFGYELLNGQEELEYVLHSGAVCMGSIFLSMTYMMLDTVTCVTGSAPKSKEIYHRRIGCVKYRNISDSIFGKLVYPMERKDNLWHMMGKYVLLNGVEITKAESSRNYPSYLEMIASNFFPVVSEPNSFKIKAQGRYSGLPITLQMTYPWGKATVERLQENPIYAIGKVDRNGMIRVKSWGKALYEEDQTSSTLQ